MPYSTQPRTINGDTLYLSRQLAARLTQLARDVGGHIQIVDKALTQAFWTLREEMPSWYDNAPYTDFHGLFSQYPNCALSLGADSLIVVYRPPSDTNPSILPRDEITTIPATWVFKHLCPTSCATLHSLLAHIKRQTR